MGGVMATTEEVIEAARQLGKLIGEHDAARKFADVMKQLREDDDAQRLLTDYNRQINTIAEKEGAGTPIEVEDKRKLDDLQTQVMTHDLLRDLQMVQMDYVDLMRRVDESMTESAPGAGGAGAGPDAGGGPGGIVPG